MSFRKETDFHYIYINVNNMLTLLYHIILAKYTYINLSVWSQG